MKKLFEITKINQMELKNRFVRSATWEGLANSDGSCSEELCSLMVELAKGEVGLIISSAAYINPTSRGGIGQLGIYDDQLVTSYKKWLKKFTMKEARLLCRLSIQVLKHWLN